MTQNTENCTENVIENHNEISAITNKIFRNPSALSRMRTRGESPPHFAIRPNYYYLRDDIVKWLQDKYQGSFYQDESEVVDKTRKKAGNARGEVHFKRRSGGKKDD